MTTKPTKPLGPSVGQHYFDNGCQFGFYVVADVLSHTYAYVKSYGWFHEDPDRGKQWVEFRPEDEPESTLGRTGNAFLIDRYCLHTHRLVKRGLLLVDCRGWQRYYPRKK